MRKTLKNCFHKQVCKSEFGGLDRCSKHISAACGSDLFIIDKACQSSVNSPFITYLLYLSLRDCLYSVDGQMMCSVP